MNVSFFFAGRLLVEYYYRIGRMNTRSTSGSIFFRVCVCMLRSGHVLIMIHPRKWMVDADWICFFFFFLVCFQKFFDSESGMMITSTTMTFTIRPDFFLFDSITHFIISLAHTHIHTHSTSCTWYWAIKKNKKHSHM